MGGKASKEEDLEWFNNGERNRCGSYVLDTVREAPRPRIAQTVDQFLRFAAAWANSLSSVLDKKQSDSGEDSWIRGFWAGMHLSNDKGEEQRCCFLIDLAAIYIFTITRSSCCCAMQTGAVMRVPLRNITSVQKLNISDGGVPVRITWKAQPPDFDSSGELTWRSTESNVMSMMGQLFDAIGLLNYGGFSDQVKEIN